MWVMAQYQPADGEFDAHKRVEVKIWDDDEM